MVGTGGISFYQVMPTYHNISGKKAYIMNVYTQPDYRRKGIAYSHDFYPSEIKEESWGTVFTVMIEQQKYMIAGTKKEEESPAGRKK